MIKFENAIVRVGDFQLAVNMTVPKGFISVIGQSGAESQRFLHRLADIEI